MKFPWIEDVAGGDNVIRLNPKKLLRAQRVKMQIFQMNISQQDRNQ
jgi:hypothetical protein